MEYSKLVDLYQKLESTPKRLEKTHLLSEFLKQVPKEDMHHIMLLVQGKVFPNWDDRKIGFAARLVLKALTISTGISVDDMEKLWKETGDLGLVAETVIKKKKQVTLFSQDITTAKVFANVQKMATLEGEGTVDRKVQLLAELLTSATPKEAIYLIRTALEDLRVGLGEGTIRDAIVWAFFAEKIGMKYDLQENDLVLPDNNRELYEHFSIVVQEAYDITNDFSKVAELAKYGEERLKEVSLEPGRPVKVMLAQKVHSMEEGLEKVEAPAAIENKYDGFRVEVHKKNGEIMLFTRRLENVTKQFPEIVDFVRENVAGESFILDSEAVGFSPKTNKYLPFQEISQRIKRKYDISEMSSKFPVELNIFDILYYEGKSYIKEEFQVRRKLLEKITTQKPLKIVLAKEIITSDPFVGQKFYHEAINSGFEGVMLKNLKAPYKPGSRVGFMVKLKPVLDMLDVVITAGEWGEGKRSGWLSTYTIAVRDEDTGEFLEIGKVGTGFKEKDEEGVSFNQITELLKPLVISEKGKEVIVKPEIVIEVSFEEVQKSPSYKSGYALRFPRLARLRNMERSAEDINTLADVEDIFYGQKKRS